MKASKLPKGEPLAVLTLILLTWAAARAMVWDKPIDQPIRGRATAKKLPGRLDPANAAPAPMRLVAAAAAISSAESARLAAETNPLAEMGGLRISAALLPVREKPVVTEPSDGRQSPWNAGFSGSPGSVPVASQPGQSASALPAAVYPAGREQAQRTGRWSADGWLLLRRGGQAPLGAGAAAPSYGASQAGAVLRYRLAPGSGRRPAAYARVAAALNGAHEKEAALGLSARPMPHVPVIAAAEVRVMRNGFGTRLRPVLMVITELPPFELPLALRGEAYAQAGYAGGRGATAFADGQLRLDRRLLRAGGVEARAGAGAWGGAQEGASRLDLGPSASLGMALGPHIAGRMTLDWRLRVAGNAAPGSGPAFTLSAGF